jgi:GNAT superfamily N-acetyltransferase
VGDFGPHPPRLFTLQGQPVGIETRAKEARDDQWIREVLTDAWRSTHVISRGVVHDAAELPAIIAEDVEGRVGLLTYRIDDSSCEVVTINSFQPGAGTALLDAVLEIARAERCRRAWLVTTNDNLRALRFYQRRGWDLVAIHTGAVDEARKLKPEIPLTGQEGIALRHELELEFRMDR